MKNKVVVDASLALKWVLQEPDSSAAEALLLSWQKQEIEMHVPALLTYEIATILYQNVRKGMISIEEASVSISDIFSTGLKVDFSHDIMTEYHYRPAESEGTISWRPYDYRARPSAIS